MAVQPVEGVLAVYYGPEAHRATYGRQVRSNRYTKDYIQLSRRPEFLETLKRLFPGTAGGARVDLTYSWPGSKAPGALDYSSDRWHLKWETHRSAPQAWKMRLQPSEETAETIPGNSSHLDFDPAEKELTLLAERGAGQPYLLAVKLRDEPRRLHLRTYLANPRKKYAWADIRRAPVEIQELAKKTSQHKAVACSTFRSGGVPADATVKATLLNLARDPAAVVQALDGEAGRVLANYLRHPGYGLFFDPARNHDAWLEEAALSDPVANAYEQVRAILDERYPPLADDDVIAEKLEIDPTQVEAFRDQIEKENFAVSDSTSTTKTRGSAQKAFADEVKSNYSMRCAVTGIETRDFLVASHIVPWSVDHSIRLDPANGICLSLIVDRAFERGHLVIEDDLSIRIDCDRIGDDVALRTQLVPHDGRKLNVPAEGAPKLEYLRRRRSLYPPTK